MLFEIYTYVLITLFGVIYGAYIINMLSIVSVAFSVSFIVLILLFIESAKLYLDNHDYLCLCLIGVALICVLINAAAGNTLVTFSYLSKAIMFVSTIIFFDIARKIQVKFTKLYKFLKILCILLSLLTIFQYFKGASHNYSLNEMLTVSLQMNFENPNKFALFLLPIFFMIVISLFKETITVMKIALVILAGFMFFFISETQSRTCIMSIVFFIILFWGLTLYNREKLPTSISFLLSIIPLVYALFYIQVVDTSFFNDLFSFAASDGKSLNSRSGIWNGVIHHFIDSPIIGAYNEISGGTGVSQAHNTHVDILASYGIVTFVLFICFMTRILSSVELKNIDQKLYLSVFIALLYCGFGEAALFAGGTGLYILVGSFLLLAKTSLRNNESFH